MWQWENSSPPDARAGKGGLGAICDAPGWAEGCAAGPGGGGPSCTEAGGWRTWGCLSPGPGEAVSGGGMHSTAAESRLAGRMDALAPVLLGRAAARRDERGGRSGRAGDRPHAASAAPGGRSGPRSAPHCGRLCSRCGASCFRCRMEPAGRMGHRRGSPRAALAPLPLLLLLLLLHVPALCPAGPGRPGPTIDGRALATRALREGESRAFTCWAPRPTAALAWYLDGWRQEPDGPAGHAASTTGAASTFTLTARRADRQLTCTLMDSASGGTANASVRLDVQFEPEILRADARYVEAEGPGLLVVLLALVQANPPAAVTWLSPDGRPVPNTSELLVPGAGSRLALTNHTVRLRLGSAAGRFSVSAANSLGVANASVLAPGLLDARVELPLLGVAVGGALALGTLLGLGLLTACVACRRAKPEPELPGPAPLPPRCSEGARLPRENHSLPPNLRLSDLVQGPGANPRDVGAGAPAEESAQTELENSLVLSNRGFIWFPMGGYIYKVSSTSSDEIWL
ncbi:transmembrane protein 25 [Struthio camelus]|uniref:transmembrane protein 25 n=1 Tax=Struthio camelus TaxID=8801 RepID=UPI003603C954